MYRESIPGYDFGRVPDAPISDRDFELLVKTVNLTEEDFRALRAVCEALSRRRDIIDKVLDTWYGWVGSNPHLLYYFGDREGRPIQRYLEAVRLRFGQWLLDTFCRDYDRQWLNYVYEVGLRHHRAKKGRTDGVETVEHIPLRYVIAFIAPIVTTFKPFLAELGLSGDLLERAFNAFLKSVVLQVAIWSHPYAREGDW